MLETFGNKVKSDFKMTKRGAFILFEGVDRCGKTTQCTRLLEFLKGSIGADKVEFMRFPDRTTSIGTTINSYLTNAQEMDDRAIHLLFAANRWEAAANIRKKLAEGVTIVCDRYSYSGVAFTSAKPGMDLDVRSHFSPLGVWAGRAEHFLLCCRASPVFFFCLLFPVGVFLDVVVLFFLTTVV